MHVIQTLKRSFLSLLLLSLYSTVAFGEEVPPASDASLPIEVVADKLVTQDLQGTSTYSGHVKITQGQTTLQGEQVILTHPEQTFSNAVITGKPATFKRFMTDTQTWVEGHALKITYQADQEHLILEGNAFINQEGQNSISGSKIIYNIKDKTLSATGDKQKQKRIKVIFTPKENDASEPEKGNTP